MVGEQLHNTVEQLVLSCLQEHGASTTLRRVVVGFSGGADSSALLVATARVLAADFKELQLLGLHVNHGLQAEADTWQSHCVAVAAQLGVAIQIEQVDVSVQGNLEANARSQRYEVFAAHCRANTLLLLGHHQHDQTETILYRLFQGRGMLPMRSHGRLGEGQFARPLLAVAPADLRAYLAAHDVSWIEDRSNQDVHFTRNFLRHEVVPLLNRHWQQIHQALVRVGSAQAAVQAALEHELQQAPDCVSIKKLPDGPAALAWLRAYLHTRGVFTVADKALHSFTKQLRDAERAELDCGDGRSLQFYDGHLYFVAARLLPEDEQTSIEPGQQLQLAGGTLSLQAAQRPELHLMCCDGPLRIGYRQGGERIALGGLSKSVKQLFAQAKVPTWQRDSYPLLYRGEELVCVPNLAVAANYQPGDAAQAGVVCVARWLPR